MKSFKSSSTLWLGAAAVLLVAATVGCGGSNSGNGDLNAFLRPWVTGVAPLNFAVGVPVSNPVITATFSEQMAPINGTATFTLSTALLPSVQGTVTLDSTKRIATFTPTNPLLASTTYTATLNGITSNTTGRAIENTYAWSFTTGMALPAVETPAKK